MQTSRRLPQRLKLGSYYLVWFGHRNKMRCQLIQPTKCGYNFLNINTSKCILRHHLYPSKCENHSTGDWFWLSERIKVEELLN